MKTRLTHSGDGRKAGAVGGFPGRRRAPYALIALRVACAPALVTLAAFDAPGGFLFAVLLLAFLSDVFDGVLARRLGMVSAKLRWADSVADTVFYVAAGATLFLVDPSILVQHALGLGGLLLLEVVRLTVEHVKFGRLAAYHMWSAKAWGATLLLGFAEVYLAREAGALFSLAIGAGIVANLEGLAASLILPTWYYDVPSAFHALAVRRLAQPNGAT